MRKLLILSNIYLGILGKMVKPQQKNVTLNVENLCFVKAMLLLVTGK